MSARSRPNAPTAAARPPSRGPGDLGASSTGADAGDEATADALCRAIGAIALSRIEIEHYLDRLHERYPSRLPALDRVRSGAMAQRCARLLKRVSRQERNRACVRDLEFWLAASLRFMETAPALVLPQALLAPDAARLERAAADGRWAAANLRRLCHWLEREQAARRG